MKEMDAMDDEALFKSEGKSGITDRENYLSGDMKKLDPRKEIEYRTRWMCEGIESSLLSGELALEDETMRGLEDNSPIKKPETKYLTEDRIQELISISIKEYKSGNYFEDSILFAISFIPFTGTAISITEYMKKMYKTFRV